MSRIWKRKDRDTWIVDYRDADGMRRRLTANSRAEAETLLATKVKESRESIPGRPDIEIPTLAQYAERWLRVVATRLKPKTVLSYGQLLSVHILPALGAVTLCEVQRMQVKRLLAEKRSAGLSKNTVRLIRATISTLFAEAQDDGIVKANPAALVARRRGSASADGLTSAERHKAIRPLSEAELHAVLMAAHNDFGYYALFLTLARCGIRPGEALGLRWEDLDLEKRELLIERAFSAGHLGTTKTGTVRRVDMSQELAATLARLYTLRDQGSIQGQLFVRFTGNAAPISASIDQIVKSLDASQLDPPMTIWDSLEIGATVMRSVANVILFMASIAVLLAITGIYAVLSFAISRRTREFGIQMTLGATRQRIFGSVLIKGLRQIAVGLLCGIVLAVPAALIFARITQRSKLPIHAFDVSVYGISAIILLVVSLCAMGLPALRATRVDPMQALRTE